MTIHAADCMKGKSIPVHGDVCKVIQYCTCDAVERLASRLDELHDARCAEARKADAAESRAAAAEARLDCALSLIAEWERRWATTDARADAAEERLADAALEVQGLKDERLSADAKAKDADLRSELADKRIAAARETVAEALLSRALWRDRAVAAKSRADAAEARLAEAARLFKIVKPYFAIHKSTPKEWIALEGAIDAFLASLPKEKL